MKPAAITLRQLEYFVAAVELGTFGAAAQRHHVSQTAVSLALRDLERALGVQLLVRRKPHRPALTPAGRLLVVRARRVLEEARELEVAALEEGSGLTGTLVVGSFPTVSPYVVGRILEGLHDRHPGLTVELVEDSVEGLQNRLKDGVCDVAILYDLAIQDGISTTPLYRCHPHAVLPAHHPLAGRPAIHLADIVHEPMVLIDLPPSVDYFLGVLARAGHEPTVTYRAGAIETVRSLVGRGLGWSMLLHRPVTDISYDGSRVAHVPLQDVDEHVDVLLARADVVRPTARVRAFSAYCAEILAPDGPS